MISVPKCGGVVEENLFGYRSWKAQYNGKQLLAKTSGGSRISQMEMGANRSGGCADLGLLIFKNFSENCMKMKEIGRRGRHKRPLGSVKGRGCFSGAPGKVTGGVFRIIMALSHFFLTKWRFPKWHFILLYLLQANFSRELSLKRLFLCKHDNSRILLLDTARSRHHVIFWRKMAAIQYFFFCTGW